LNTFKLYLISALGGVFFALAFPPMPFNALAFIFIIPILFALEQKPEHWYRLSYTFSFFLNLGTLWWVGSWQENADPFLMISGIAIILFHPFFYFIVFYIYKFFRKRFNFNTALLLFPLIWTFYDWFTSKTDFAFPWIAAGYTQTNNFYWNQIADIGGVWLLGLFILYINVFIYKLIIQFVENDFRIKSFLNINSVKKNILLLLLLITVPLVYSAFKLNEFENYSSAKKLKIAIIQPDIDPWDKWSMSTYDNINKHIKVQDSLLEANNKYDLALWSETSITYSNPEMNSKPYNVPQLQNWVDKNNISIITGFSEIFFYDSIDSAPVTAKKYGNEDIFYQSYNSSILISPNKYNDTIQIYRKMILTPFSERLPYVEIFSFAQDFIGWDVGISNWGLGWNQSNLKCHLGENESFSIPSIICIESTQPNFVRKFAKNGAEIFTIITNDAWFKYTFGPAQHFAIAQMRAIENKRFIARCSNSGISGFINPTGTIIKQAKPYCDTGTIEDIPAVNYITIYSSIGDIFPYLSILILIYFISLNIFNKKK